MAPYVGIIVGFILGGALGLFIAFYFDLPFESEAFTGFKVGGQEVTKTAAGDGSVVSAGMAILGMVIGLFVGLGVASATSTDGKEDNKDKLQGEWIPVSVELRNNVMSEEELQNWRLIIRGDEWQEKSNTDGRQNFKMTFKIDPSKAQKEIDFKWTGPGGKEGALKGIYKLDGDTLTICKRTQDNMDRPEAFEAGDYTLLSVFKCAGTN